MIPAFALVALAILVVGLFRLGKKGPSAAPVSSSSPEVLADARALAIELGRVFEDVEATVRAGITTKEIEKCVADSLESRKLRSSFLGYHGYPNICTTSINDEVINTMPSNRLLRGGDLLKLQIGVRGEHGVALQGWTYVIGPINEEDARLLRVAREALRAAVAAVGPEARVGDIGWAIQSTVEEAGFNVNRNFVGMGMGRAAHEDPPIPLYGTPGRGVRLKRDRVYCLFVIAHAGTHECKTAADHWNCTTLDGRNAVLFSQMVMVLGASGVEVLSPPRPEPWTVRA